MLSIAIFKNDWYTFFSSTYFTLNFLPNANVVEALRPELSLQIAAVVVPLREAILLRVSPFFTVTYFAPDDDAFALERLGGFCLL
jgi:hypothetical protein